MLPLSPLENEWKCIIIKTATEAHERTHMLLYIHIHTTRRDKCGPQINIDGHIVNVYISEQ